MTITSQPPPCQPQVDKELDAAKLLNGHLHICNLRQVRVHFACQQHACSLQYVPLWELVSQGSDDLTTYGWTCRGAASIQDTLLEELIVVCTFAIHVEFGRPLHVSNKHAACLVSTSDGWHCEQVVVDLSRAASIQDMRPNRAAAMASVLVIFIREFFDQNPLSHLGIIIMRNGRSERLSELSASPVSLTFPFHCAAPV